MIEDTILKTPTEPPTIASRSFGVIEDDDGEDVGNEDGGAREDDEDSDCVSDKGNDPLSVALGVRLIVYSAFWVYRGILVLDIFDKKLLSNPRDGEVTITFSYAICCYAA